jgi:ribonuclease D
VAGGCAVGTPGATTDDDRDGMPLRELTKADTPDALANGLAELREHAVVGVDVERADWDRYFRTPALIQIGGAGRVTVVDPLALADLDPLGRFLDARMAVFHAIDNDLPPLRARGVDPAHVEDTAVAAALLGLPTGLAALLEQLLGIVLEGDKAAMQRADWEARPLSADMLAYAAADVADLPALWDDLWQRLVATGRTAWYREELAALLARPAVEDRRAWDRVKGVGRLDPAARARMHALWSTREELARRTDTAPNRIAGDKVLVDLATRPPAGTHELARRGMRRQAVRDFGEQLLAALVDPPAAPGPTAGRRPTDEDRAKADELRVIRAGIARDLGLDPGVLCPSRGLMGALLTEPADGEALRTVLGLRHWQWEQVGPAFCEALGIGEAGSAVVPTAVRSEDGGRAEP